MSNRRSVEGGYRVEASVLDELGLDRLPSAAEAGFPFLRLIRHEWKLVPFPGRGAVGFVFQ
jgi:hypothetical protein